MATPKTGAMQKILKAGGAGLGSLMTAASGGAISDYDLQAFQKARGTGMKGVAKTLGGRALGKVAALGTGGIIHAQDIDNYQKTRSLKDTLMKKNLLGPAMLGATAINPLLAIPAGMAYRMLPEITPEKINNKVKQFRQSEGSLPERVKSLFREPEETADEQAPETNDLAEEPTASADPQDQENWAGDLNRRQRAKTRMLDYAGDRVGGAAGEQMKLEADRVRRGDQADISKGLPPTGVSLAEPPESQKEVERAAALNKQRVASQAGGDPTMRHLNDQIDRRAGAGMGETQGEPTGEGAKKTNLSETEQQDAAARLQKEKHEEQKQQQEMQERQIQARHAQTDRYMDRVKRKIGMRKSLRKTMRKMKLRSQVWTGEFLKWTILVAPWSYGLSLILTFIYFLFAYIGGLAFAGIACRFGHEWTIKLRYIQELTGTSTDKGEGGSTSPLKLGESTLELLEIVALLTIILILTIIIIGIIVVVILIAEESSSITNVIIDLVT